MLLDALGPQPHRVDAAGQVLGHLEGERRRPLGVSDVVVVEVDGVEFVGREPEVLHDTLERRPGDGPDGRVDAGPCSRWAPRRPRPKQQPVGAPTAAEVPGGHRFARVVGGAFDTDAADLPVERGRREQRRHRPASQRADTERRRPGAGVPTVVVVACLGSRGEPAQDPVHQVSQRGQLRVIAPPSVAVRPRAVPLVGRSSCSRVRAPSLTALAPDEGRLAVIEQQGPAGRGRLVPGAHDGLRARREADTSSG